MITRNVSLSLLLTASAITCWAAAPQGPGGQGRRPPTPAIDTVLDTDGDEIISAAEIAAAPTRLSTLDADDNNQLSFDECMGSSSRGNDRQPPGGAQRGPGGQPPAPPIFGALDSDDDQHIDEDEMANAAAALEQLDTNSDGRLTTDEYRPQRRR